MSSSANCSERRNEIRGLERDSERRDVILHNVVSGGLSEEVTFINFIKGFEGY